SSAEQCRYLSEQTNYGGTLQVHKTTFQASARILTLVEVAERRLRFTSHVAVRANAATFLRATVRLRNWKGQEVKLNAPAAALREEYRDNSGAITWLLDLFPSSADEQALKLIGEVALPVAGDLLMPDIVVDEIPVAEQWLAVVGRQLRADEARGLAPVVAAQALRSWPTLKEYLHGADAQLWKAE